MKKTVKILLSVMLLAVFLVSTGGLVRNFLGYGDGDSAYDDAAQLARPDDAPETGTKCPEETEQPVAVTQPEEEETTSEEEPVIYWVPVPTEEPDPKMEKLEETELEPLRKVNEDVIGWIQIPGTKIDYPLLQGEDNEYYLKRTWKGNRNHVGSVFLECMNSPDMTDWNTIIYAHNMGNGSMFVALHNYRKPDYWEKHPYVYIVTDLGVLRYEVFSSYTAEVGSKTYGLSFRQMKTREEFLEMALEKSQIDTGIQPQVTDQIITLSTCSSGEERRRVVHARMPMMQIIVE